MITYETKVEKNSYNGWSAETLIPMGQTIAPSLGFSGGERTLSITTCKTQRGINSFATVYIISPGSRMTEVFGDYRKHFNATPVKMVNEKRIREAHAVALQSADAILAEALGFYAKKEAA